MKVSVIIVNFHTSDLIINSIKSILKYNSFDNIEFIIVDNNSEPDIKKKISNVFPKNINFKVIQTSENIGFGRANNLGITASSGEYLFFLNPDTICLNNAVTLLSEFLDSNPETGACGGNLYNDDLTPAFSFRRFFPGLLWELDSISSMLLSKVLFKNKYYHNPDVKPLEVAFISGADIMVRKSIINQMGGFNPEYFMYFEETDLCFRISKAGYKIYNIPSAKIIHLEGKSFKHNEKTESPIKIENLEKSKIIYYKRNIPKYKRLILFFLYRIFLTSRFLLVNNPVKRNNYKLHLEYHNKYRSIN